MDPEWIKFFKITYQNYFGSYMYLMYRKVWYAIVIYVEIDGMCYERG